MKTQFASSRKLILYVGVATLAALLVGCGGDSVGRTILILPFGLLPILFFLGFIIFHKTDESLRKGLGSKITSGNRISSGNKIISGNKTKGGITEYPLEVSMCLYGSNENEIAFSDDGKSIILTFDSAYHINYDNPAEVKQLYFLGNNLDILENVDLDWVNHYNITNIGKNKETGKQQIIISMPDEVVLTDQYIDHEIQNIGRVFTRNAGPAAQRWLLWSGGKRKTIREHGRLLVYIDRIQRVPGIFDSFGKEKIMSEKQITRNIKNRLWNRVDVKCISITESTYCGEIMGV